MRRTALWITQFRAVQGADGGDALESCQGETAPHGTGKIGGVPGKGISAASMGDVLAQSQPMLFTSGPTKTAHSVRQAMLRDLDPSDPAFTESLSRIRRGLLEIGGVTGGGFEAVLMQGDVALAVESVIGSITPAGGTWLFVINGAYAREMMLIADRLGIPHVRQAFPENRQPSVDAVGRALESIPEISHVAAVHCESTTGIINPIGEIGSLAQQRDKVFFVNAAASFGAVPIDFAASAIDYLVAPSDACLESVPGLSLVLARRDRLVRTQGCARSASLDLYAHWQNLEKNGRVRVTLPAHALLALERALVELACEGGVAARAERYRRNHERLIAGMRALGFRECLAPSIQGYVVTSFRCPAHLDFNVDAFLKMLYEQGFVIQASKVNGEECLRIGAIGQVTVEDVERLLAAISAVMAEMGLFTASMSLQRTYLTARRS